MKKRQIGIGTVKISKRGKTLIGNILESGRLTYESYTRINAKDFFWLSSKFN